MRRALGDFQERRAANADARRARGAVDGATVPDAAGVVLQVAQDAVNAAVSRALASLPVHDLTVENAPLEEVMSELFAQSRAARGDVEDAA